MRRRAKNFSSVKGIYFSARCDIIGVRKGGRYFEIHDRQGDSGGVAEILREQRTFSNAELFADTRKRSDAVNDRSGNGTAEAVFHR